jgi:hypothetical protein
MKSLATIKPRFRGPDGKKLQLNTSETHLQWRLEGDTAWTDLATLDSLATLAMPRSGGVFTGNVQVRNILETLVVPAGTIAGAVNLDLSQGNVFQLLMAGNITKFNLINVPQPFSGQTTLSFSIFLQQGSSELFTTNFNISVNGIDKTIRWPGGFVPIVSSTYAAVDILSFLTTDTGETWFGFVGGQGY